MKKGPANKNKIRAALVPIDKKRKTNGKFYFGVMFSAKVCFISGFTDANDRQVSS